MKDEQLARTMREIIDMTEQERSNKFRADMENALHQDRSLTMIAQTIWELAKAYADARVAQECKVLDEVVTLLHQTIANRNVEIDELKSESKYWKDRWEAGNKFQDAAFNSEIENYHEVKRLNAEIKRLRGALMWLKVNRTPDRAMIEVFIDKALSPAPVTDASKWISVNKSLPERGQAVLVCMKSGAITIAYLKLNIQVWQVFGDLNASFDPFDEIHHWMPLPLQPEPREN